jgi:ubiquinone biosynthesis protein Coq4
MASPAGVNASRRAGPADAFLLGMKNVVQSMVVFWRRLRGYWAGLQLLRDPSKLDSVFLIDDALPGQDELLGRIVDAMRVHEGAARALTEQPRLAIDLAALRALPEGTFGRAVATFLDDNGLDPASIPRLDAGDERAWTKAHLYETHDVWHVATRFATDEAGELGLQAFYAAQLPGRLPQMLLAGGLLQAAFWRQDDFRRRLAAIARGWDAGTRARPLFGVRWDAMWARPEGEVSEELALA